MKPKIDGWQPRASYRDCGTIQEETRPLAGFFCLVGLMDEGFDQVAD